MTTLQKAIIGATFALAVGTNLYQGRHNSQLRDRLQTVRQQFAELTEQARQLRNERDSTFQTVESLRAEKDRVSRDTAEEVRLRGEVARLRTNAQEIARLKAKAESESNGPAAATVKSWTERVNRLKELVERTPEAKIPEFLFLTTEDWLGAATKGDNDRKTLWDLRQLAENRFSNHLQAALRKYVDAHNSQAPTDLAQVQPYFEPPIDNAVLQRWKIAPASEVPYVRIGASDWVVTQKALPIDEEYDLRMVIILTGNCFTSNDSVRSLFPAVGAFHAANEGRDYEHLSQLVPYVTTPEQRVALGRLLENERRWQSILSRN
jgi:plasmid stabilization system protein ParE